VSDPFDPDSKDDADGEDTESYYGMDAIGIDPPEVSVPDATTEFESGDVDPGLRTLFWKVVVAVKLTLLTLTIGAMLVISGENPTLGRRVLVLAAVLAGYTVYQYRTTKQRLESGEFESADGKETDREGSPPDSAAESADGGGDGRSGSGQPGGVAASGSDESPGEPDVEGT